MTYTVLHEITKDRAEALDYAAALTARCVLRNEGVDNGVSPTYVPLIIAHEEEA